MDQLAKHAAELALRLAALPSDGLRHDVHALDAIEQLAARVLREIAVVRASAVRPVGETSGMWRAVGPAQGH